MATKFKSTKLLNAVTIVWCWIFYCILGTGLLPNMVTGARYLPTRRSAPTQLERSERMRELFQHVCIIHFSFNFIFEWKCVLIM